MYIADGFVCSAEPVSVLKVTEVKPLDNMIMLVKFNTGETRLFDASLLSGSVFEPLKKQTIFNNPTLEFGVVTWDDGKIDCSPEYMLENSFEYTQSFISSLT